MPAGSTVTFTYAVTDTGDVPLANVFVTDDQLGLLLTFLTGDSNSNGLLDLTETWIYTATATALTGQQGVITLARPGSKQANLPTGFPGTASSGQSRAATATIGRAGGWPPSDPEKARSEKSKTPPSSATIR